MSIVNIRKNPTYDVYIGKNINLSDPNILENSGLVHGEERYISIGRYACDFPQRWRSDPYFKEAVLATRGKTLGCFCNTETEICHGMIIEIFLKHFDKYGQNGALLFINNIARNSNFSVMLMDIYHNSEENI